MANRDKLQAFHYDKLISNLHSIADEGFDFNINMHDELFTFQRNPFYNPVVIDSYQYIICSVFAKSQLELQSKETVSKNNKPFVPKTALVNAKYILFSLSANHPRYGRIKLISGKFKKNTPNKIYLTFCIKLYDNKQQLNLLCKMEMTSVTLTNSVSKSIQNMRKQMKDNVSSQSMSIKDFKFIDKPSNVGQISSNAVFLSKLKYLNNIIYCDGLINFYNGFDRHPYICGTGDHINSGHSLHLCEQFLYLLIRNSNKFPFKSQLLMIIDSKCYSTIFSADLQFKKYLELGQFVIKLINIRREHCTHNAMNTSIGNCFICKTKIPYSFHVELCIEQNQGVQDILVIYQDQDCKDLFQDFLQIRHREFLNS